MHSANITTDPMRTVVRWTARVLSILFMGVFILLFFRGNFDPHAATPREWVSFFFFPLGASLGMILAWWQEGLGDALTVLSVFVSVLVHDPSAGGGYALSCASPGFLFLLSWMLSLSMTNPGRESSAKMRREE
jgi:hypothetical protein